MPTSKSNLASTVTEFPAETRALRLEAHPFFQGLSRESMQAMAKAAEVINYEKGMVIFEEGSEPDAMYLVMEGRVAFEKSVPGSKSRVISYAESGDFFGEIGVLTGAARALHAVTNGAATLARLPREALREFIRRTPGPVDLIVQSIVNHLNHTTTHYVEDMIHQEKMTMVGSMVNTIIHDFKNPFTLISLGAQLLMKQHQDERTRHLCTNMMRQIERMVEMANELSEFARGTQTVKPARVDLRRLVERFQELNDPYFHKPKLNLTLEVDPVVIEAEENKLLRVLQNLVSNAIDAVDDEPDGRVIVRIRDAGEQCEIMVSDNGKGIPEQIRHNLFEPFVTHGKTHGTGLGTAIVKSVIEAHKGTIRFETATNKGTTFYITLPKSQGSRA